MNELTVVISREIGANRDRRDFENAAAELIAGAGVGVWLVPHLCHLPENDGLWQKFVSLSGKPAAVFSWIHPRPAKWILARHGLDISERNVFDMRALDSPVECIERFRTTFDLPEKPDPGCPVELMSDVSERWFPVIDYSRCKGCRQCMQFCLFGVYEVQSGRVFAANPDNCKNGCPACSRICPHGAIMFPLCKTDEAIAGAPGLLMKPDPGSKSMYYQRTGKPCPVCGRTFSPALKPKSPDAAICNECGLILDTGVKTADNADSVASDLDSLIDDLENLR